MKSLARIFALVIRYFYLIKTSFPRISRAYVLANISNDIVGTDC